MEMIAIKKLCKNIDITNPETIKPWIRECVIKHRKRHDFKALLRHHGMDKGQYIEMVETGNIDLLEPALDSLSLTTAELIRNHEPLNLPKPIIRTRLDVTTGKIREIGCECAMQQVLDIIAVNGAMDVLMRRIKPQQASSVVGRGQIYGMHMIRRWVKKDNAKLQYAHRHQLRATSDMKYFVKCDIRHCYQNMRLEHFMRLFERDCGNADLIWLWHVLLESHRIDDKHQGFMIGALTSQWAAQYVISFAYDHIMALKTTPRRGKERKLVSHMCFFMDDILMTSSSRRSLVTATRSLVHFMMSEFSLTIKPNWDVKEFSDQGIDMMGFIVYRTGKVAIRARNYVRARRMALRAKNHISYKQAKRIASYKGFFTHTDSQKAKAVLMLPAVWANARKVVSECDKRRSKRNGKSFLQRKARSDQVHAPAKQQDGRRQASGEYY